MAKTTIWDASRNPQRVNLCLAHFAGEQKDILGAPGLEPRDPELSGQSQEGCCTLQIRWAQEGKYVTAEAVCPLGESVMGVIGSAQRGHLALGARLWEGLGCLDP